MKISLKRFLLITGATGAVFFLVTVIFLTFYLPGHTYNYYIESTLKSLGLPIRLKIPKINVNTVVEHLGLTSEGAMDVPKGPADVAWFNLGPRPGDNGSAVIAGHYGNWKNGEGSVFDNLSKLNPGDRIYIEDENGATVSFIVRQLRTYDPKADSSGIFASDDGKSHLNLITCEGEWNSVQKTYSQRLVVFSDKE